MKLIKWGFVGCGEVTEKKSGPAFRKVEGSDVVAVMSRDAEKACRYAERHNIGKWYTDAQQLINDDEVNAVYIATPPSSHASYAIMAMKAGKPVYVEKPLAASYEDCARIIRVSQQTGVPCFVAYYRRYLPYFLKVGEIIKSGVLGTPVSVTIRFATPPRKLDYNRDNLPWRLQPDIAGGGYFYDLAPHQLDILQHFFGVITEAKGFAENRAHLYDAEDSVTACFRFENGLIGSGSWCFVCDESAAADRIDINGTHGSVYFSVFNYKPICLSTDGGDEYFDISNPEHVQLPLIEAVVKHLQGDGVCDCDCVSSTLVNWVMDKILKKF